MISPISVLGFLVLAYLSLAVFKFISYFYLNIFPGLLVLAIFLALSYLIIYPIYFIYIYPTYIPNLLYNYKIHILNKPRRILWRLEFWFYAETRDLIFGVYDPGPPEPPLYPLPDHYNRYLMIGRLIKEYIKQCFMDLFGIPYKYYAIQYANEQKRIREQTKEKSFREKLISKTHHYGHSAREMVRNWYRGNDSYYHDNNGYMYDMNGYPGFYDVNMPFEQQRYYQQQYYQQQYYQQQQQQSHHHQQQQQQQIHQQQYYGNNDMTSTPSFWSFNPNIFNLSYNAPTPEYNYNNNYNYNYSPTQYSSSSSPSPIARTPLPHVRFSDDPPTMMMIPQYHSESGWSPLLSLNQSSSSRDNEGRRHRSTRNMRSAAPSPSSSPPESRDERICTCNVRCELHPIRFTLDNETLLPEGTIVIPAKQPPIPLFSGHQTQHTSITRQSRSRRDEYDSRSDGFYNPSLYQRIFSR